MPVYCSGRWGGLVYVRQTWDCTVLCSYTHRTVTDVTASVLLREDSQSRAGGGKRIQTDRQYYSYATSLYTVINKDAHMRYT